MKKICLLALCLLGFSQAAEARQARPRIDVAEVSLSSCTTFTIDIETTPTLIPPAAIRLSSAALLGVDNIDTTSTINCSWNIAVSATSSEQNYGKEIAPKTERIWQFPLDQMLFYCITQGGAATRATLTQCRI